MNWINIKPEFKEECLLLTATCFRGQWEYSIWRIEKIEVDESWYLGLLNGDGEEWGDLEDLKADLYCVMPLLTTPLTQSK